MKRKGFRGGRDAGGRDRQADAMPDEPELLADDPFRMPGGGDDDDHEGELFEGRVVHGEANAELDADRWVVRAVPETRQVPLIAIVGRPNVGKSRLFNRLTGTRFAIVEDMPGVTRDRQYGDGHYSRWRYQVVDTGGFDPESEDVLLSQMRSQAQLAIDEANIIFFVMDGQSGLVPADREIARLLRHTSKPVYAIVNKIDGARHEGNLADFWELGFSALYGISAEHGRCYDELMDDVVPLLPTEDSVEHTDPWVRVAVLGKPNAGKSTLINKLLGEDRLLTSDVPGTTRDAINTFVEQGDKKYLFIDTAGIRRKRSIDEQVERYAVVQSFKAIDRADVVLYLIDATVGLTAQDQRIVGLAHDKGRAIILVLNKWDQVAKDHRTADLYIKALREELRFATYAPVVTISALSGQRVHRLYPLIDSAFEQYQRRVSTSKLNATVREAMTRNPPKSRHNQVLRLYFCSQVATRPPTFMFVVNDQKLVHFSYHRYLNNMLRAEFGFEGAPLKIFFRARKQNEPEEQGDH
jgi:GTP-binding protein